MDQLHDVCDLHDDDDAQYHHRGDGCKCFHDEVLNHVHVHMLHHDDDQDDEEGDDDDEDHNCYL